MLTELPISYEQTEAMRRNRRMGCVAEALARDRKLSECAPSRGFEGPLSTTGTSLDSDMTVG